MLPIPYILLGGLEESAKVPILLSLFHIGHVVESGFFLELEKAIKGFLAKFACIHSR